MIYVPHLDQTINSLEKYFDVEVYGRNSGQHFDTSHDAAHHYCTVGVSSGIDPTDWFSTNEYLRSNDDVSACGVNPFWHFVFFGLFEGRFIQAIEKLIASTSRNIDVKSGVSVAAIARSDIADTIRPHFDELFYRRKYLIPEGVDCIQHYSIIGWRLGFDPSPTFSSTGYIVCLGGASTVVENPLYDWAKKAFAQFPAPGKEVMGELFVDAVKFGTEGAHARRLRGNVELVDGRVIRGWLCNLDKPAQRMSIQAVAPNGVVIAEVVADCWREELEEVGIGDGRYGFDITIDDYHNVELEITLRESSSEFKFGRVTLRGDVPALKTRTEREVRSGRDHLFAQFIDGVPECQFIDDQDIKINIFYYHILTTYRLFDVEFYVSKYRAYIDENVTPIKHYIIKGSSLGFWPNPYFDPREYLYANPDVADLSVDAVIHYFMFGWGEGRCAGSLFDEDYYLSRYPDVRSAGLNPLYHYLAFGRAEGRNPTRPLASQLRENELSEERHSGTIIIVSHDVEVGGAQAVARAFGKWLLRSTRYDIRFVSLRDGAHRQQFEDIRETFVLSDHHHVEIDVIQARLAAFAGENVRAIFVNSVASAAFFEFWPHPTPAICYIHELPKIIDMFPGSVDILKARCKTVVAGSEAVRSALRTVYDVPADKCSVVYDFIDKRVASAGGAQRRAEARQKLGIDLDTFVVMGCGVLHWRKAPDKFIDVAQLVTPALARRARFVWIGGGPDEKACRALIAEKNLAGSVDLIGYQEDVPSLLEAADVFLLPSEEDPFPLVCLYAAASQVPVICFEGAGGMPEFVARGCGVAVPFGNVQAMAEETLRYARDPERQARHGETGRRVVEEGFTVTAAGPKLLDFLRRAACRPPVISVIVPNYNYLNFLEQRLSTIYNQSFQDFEVILLDDASSDGSAEYLMATAAIRPATRVLLNQVNSGSPFLQWLKGMRDANSEFVWIAEADDYCEPDFLEKLLPSLANRNVFLAHALSVPVGGTGEILGSYETLYLDRINEGRWSRSYIESDHLEVNAGLAIGNTIPNASAVVLRRFEPDAEFAAVVGGMRMCGDWFFYLRAIRGGDVAFVRQPLNYHRRHGKTVTHQTEGSLRYFDELATTRAYVGRTWRISEETRNKAATFTRQDLDRFGIEDPKIRRQIEGATALPAAPAKTRPTLLIVISDLSPGGGQMFGIRLANSWMRAGGRAALLNVGNSPDHEQVVAKIDSRVSLFDVRTEGFLFADLVAEFDVDVVHSSMWWADRYVHLHFAELPDHVVWCSTTHGCYETLLEHPEVDSTFPFRFTDMLERVDHWIYTAEKNLGVFNQMGHPKRLTKIDNGFEPEPGVAPPRDALGLREDSLVLLLATRAIREKGWFEAVEAVRQLNEAGLATDLMLVGEGPVAETMRADGVPEFVHLYGQISNLADYIAVCDVGLLPSYFEGESMPLVLIEMLAQGKPIVASDIGEIPAMMVRDGAVAGAVVPLRGRPVDAGALAAAVASIANPEVRAAAGRIARSIFEARFTMAGMLEAYGEIYAERLAARRGPSGRRA